MLLYLAVRETCIRTFLNDKLHYFFPHMVFKSMKKLFHINFYFLSVYVFSVLLVIVLTVSLDNHITVTLAIFIRKPQGSWGVSAAFDLDLSLRFSFLSLPQYRQQIYLNKEEGVWHLGTVLESETVNRALWQKPPARNLTCEYRWQVDTVLRRAIVFIWALLGCREISGLNSNDRKSAI